MKHKRDQRRRARALKQAPRELPPALKKAVDDIVQAMRTMEGQRNNVTPIASLPGVATGSPGSGEG